MSALVEEDAPPLPTTGLHENVIAELKKLGFDGVTYVGCGPCRLDVGVRDRTARRREQPARRDSRIEPCVEYARRGRGEAAGDSNRAHRVIVAQASARSTPASRFFPRRYR